MKGNFPNESKNKWTRIFKKKWVFPALYIMIAAFLLTAVLWYQNLERKLSEGMEDLNQSENYNPDPYDEDAESVLQQTEIIKMPVTEDVQTEIVTKFFDYSADQEDQEKGLNLYNNRYYQSKGIDIASVDGDTFDVVASLSGTVKEVKEDPLLGNVVIMEHGEDVTTYYASLGEIEVTSGEKVNQGGKIGTAGKNLFGQESGTHVHFEIRKGDTEVNPEDFFNEPLSKLEQFNIENQKQSSEQQEDSDSDDEKDPEKPVPNPNPNEDEDESDDNSDKENNDSESDKEDNQQDEAEDNQKVSLANMA